MGQLRHALHGVRRCAAQPPVESGLAVLDDAEVRKPVEKSLDRRFRPRQQTFKSEVAGGMVKRVQRGGSTFYGTWIVAGCFLLLFLFAGPGFYSFSIFIKPLEDDFGWTRSAIWRSFRSSVPKIFTARLARDPESMWSMRCDMG